MESGKAEGLAPKTLARRANSLRSYGKWIGEPLLADYRAPSPPPAQPRPITGGHEAIMRMVEVAVGDDERAMILLCGFVGLRISEARSVTPDMIEIEDGTPWVTVTGKGYKRRSVPIPPRAWEILGPVVIKRPRHQPLVRLTDSQARKAWATCSRQAGLGKTSSHQGRATAATALLDSTGNLRLVQEVLGHASVATTQVYTRVSRSTMAEAMAGL